ncbi:MAG: O-antigen ligase family protein [Spirochaetota bacterium]|nr:O-antigen ligase family protein [Spirochaetota bacterium]
MSIAITHSKIYRISFFFLSFFLITSGISITVSQGALLLSLIFWLYGYIRKYNDIRYNYTGLELYIGVFIIVSVVLAFLSPSFINNLLYLRDFWLISAFLLASSLINNRDDIIKIVRIMIIIGIFHSIVGAVQYFTDIDFVNAYKYGIDHPKSRLGIRYVVGFLGHHLPYGGYMMISIPLIYLSFLKKDDYKGIFFVRMSSFMSFIAIIFSWARSVIVSLPFAVIPLFFIKRKIFFIISSVIVLIMLVVLSVRGPSNNIVGNMFNNSTNQRLLIWKNAFRVWLKHPVFGSGGGNYIDEFKDIVKEHPEDDPHMISNAHNDCLNQLVRKGIIGLLAFLFLLYGIFRYMYKNLPLIKDRLLRFLYLGLFGFYSAFLVASMFQCYFTDEENLVMFWFYIGLLCAIVRIEKH